jgi:hypothetical protein
MLGGLVVELGVRAEVGAEVGGLVVELGVGAKVGAEVGAEVGPGVVARPPVQEGTAPGSPTQGPAQQV